MKRHRRESIHTRGRRHGFLALFTLLLGVGVSMGVVSCSKPPEPPPAELPEAALADLVLREGALGRPNEDHPFTGFVVERYASGALQSRSSVSNGLLHGVSEGWYTNGVLQVREFFVQGVSHGVRTKWGPSGEPLSESPIIQGKLHGTFKRWHTNGAVSEVIEMRDNQPDGIARSFDLTGQLVREVHFQNGREIPAAADPSTPPDASSR